MSTASIPTPNLPNTSIPSTVGQLEEALLRCYPASHAEAWDKTGLLVGDPSAALTGVAVALDPTPRAVQSCVEHGANVLLTHHPAFLQPPEAFGPMSACVGMSGAVVWEAARAGVALMSFHTALDVSPDAACVLPKLLGLSFEGIIETIAADPTLGYGQRCSVSIDDGGAISLSCLAERCIQAFGRAPRVWGQPNREIRSVVTCTGSAADLPSCCLAAGIDCLVAGEVKYHDALAAAEAGLAVIELGHDVSELPLAQVLHTAVCALGVDRGAVFLLDQGSNWSCPQFGEELPSKAQASLEQASLDQASLEQAAPKQAGKEPLSHDQASIEQPARESVVSKQAAPKQAGPEQAAPEQTTADNEA